MTRAFFCEASDDQWFDAADVLARSHGWEIVGWSGSAGDPSAFAERVSRAHPDALHHDSYEAVRGIPPRSRRDTADPDVGAELWRELAEVEWQTIRMMDRVQLVRDSFPVDERMALYRRLVRYWQARLDELRLDVIVHPTAPHLVYDYVLHELARRRGVRTISFERTWSPARVLVVADIRVGPRDVVPRFRELSAAGAEPALDDATASELARLRQPYDAAVSTVHRHKLDASAATQASERRSRVLARLRRPAELLGWLRPLRTSYGKIPWRRVDAAWPTTAHLRWADRVGERDKQRLRTAYDRVVRPHGGEYVYLPLHFQPERTTSPLGGRFVEPRTMVETVAAALPDGWQLVVREHPLTLRRHTRGHLARDDRLYDDLAAMPGVVLASLDADPFELLDGSRAVATVTGTTGWEALARGKHVLVLGPAWYAGCEGTHEVRSTDDARAALAVVAASPPPSRRAVELFAQAADDVAHRAFTATILADITGGAAAGSGDVLAGAIASSLSGGS